MRTLPIRGISGKNIFAELYERCPKNQLTHLQLFDSKNRAILEKIYSMPDKLPEIDWDYYMKNVRGEFVKVVEDFQKKYCEFQVPIPEEKSTQEVEKLRCEVEKEIKDYVDESNKRIAEYEKELKRIKELLPFEEMTWDDYIVSYPDHAPNFIEKPTFWPHTPEEQVIIKSPPKKC